MGRSKRSVEKRSSHRRKPMKEVTETASRRKTMPRRASLFPSLLDSTALSFALRSFLPFKIFVKSSFPFSFEFRTRARTWCTRRLFRESPRRASCFSSNSPPKRTNSFPGSFLQIHTQGESFARFVHWQSVLSSLLPTIRFRIERKKAGDVRRKKTITIGSPTTTTT